MKKQFKIIKNRPTVEIKLTRDSVSAGDDINAPHKEIINQPSFIDPITFIENLYLDYLPSVEGVGHTWDCLLNGKLIGVVSTSGITPKTEEIKYNEENRVHFRYNSSTY